MRRIRFIAFALPLLTAAACSGGGSPHGVPNVVGKSACDALPVLVHAGLVPDAVVATEIGWTVESQQPLPGTRFVHGDEVQLVLKQPTTSAADCQGVPTKFGPTKRPDLFSPGMSVQAPTATAPAR